MPIKPIPPRKGKSPYWSGRGSHLGVRVNRSTKAGKRALAVKVIRQWEREIEGHTFRQPGEPTFGEAAAEYMKHDGERRFVNPLLDVFEHTPLKAIDQAAIDRAALQLYPNASAATRNRHVYTPMSAILQRAGIDRRLRRPEGSAGKAATGWLWPEEAERLFAEAETLNPEFALLLRVLCYTGMRLSEALKLRTDSVRLGEAFAYVPTTKNGKPRTVHLPNHLVAALANHPRGMERPDERVFRFSKGGHIYSLLTAAASRAGVTLPERQAFHLFRHTWATWMRRYAGLDTSGLVATGAWTSRHAAARYEHVVVSEEARRADMLPVPKLRIA